MNKHASKLSRLRVALLVLLAVFLLWQVITKSLAEYFANAWPEIAIGLRSTNSTALLNLADAKLGLERSQHVEAASQTGHSNSDLKGSEGTQESNGGSPASSAQSGPPRSAGANSKTNAQIRSWAELALLNDPLNAQAFGILGKVAQGDSDDRRTETLMHAAMRRSLRESVAVYWIMQKSYRDQDYGAAIRYADTLLRTRSPDEPVVLEVMQILAKIAENEKANGPLKTVLAGNPLWRRDFFDRLPANISDARTPLDILMSLKDTPIPPTAEDIRSYLNLLVGHRFYDLAYYTWLQFLPAEQLAKVGHLFNGSFEIIPSGLPFDWVFAEGSNVAMKVAARPDQDGEHALFIEFGPGRVDWPGMKQLIILPPGSYQFQGKYKAEVDSKRGLQWRITCGGEATNQIGESPVVTGSESAWKDFAFSFTVPESDCPAQYVELVFDARWASEQFISGSIWYDDLQIVQGVDSENAATSNSP